MWSDGRMKLYAESPGRRTAQVVADLLLVAWLVAWVWAGSVVHDATLELAGPGPAAHRVGDRARPGRCTDAGGTLGDVPVSATRPGRRSTRPPVPPTGWPRPGRDQVRVGGAAGALAGPVGGRDPDPAGLPGPRPAPGAVRPPGDRRRPVRRRGATTSTCSRCGRWPTSRCTCWPGSATTPPGAWRRGRPRRHRPARRDRAALGRAADAVGAVTGRQGSRSAARCPLGARRARPAAARPRSGAMTVFFDHHIVPSTDRDPRRPVLRRGARSARAAPRGAVRRPRPRQRRRALRRRLGRTGHPAALRLPRQRGGVRRVLRPARRARPGPLGRPALPAAAAGQPRRRRPRHLLPRPRRALRRGDDGAVRRPPDAPSRRPDRRRQARSDPARGG